MKTIGLFAVCAMILLAGVTFAIATEPPAEEMNYELPEVQGDTLSLGDESSVDVMTDTGYVVRSENGSVNVYSTDGEKLMELDILPTKLRSADAAMFAKGIAVADKEALARLIEDFSS